MSTDTPVPTPPAVAPELGESFDLLDWINTGTIATREVEIWTDVAAGERAAQLVDRITELEAAQGEQERPADGPLDEAADDGELGRLRDELEDVGQRLAASRMVVTVRALSKDDVDELVAAIPMPHRPVPPPQGAAAAAQEKFSRAIEGYIAEQGKVENERKLATVSKAVTSVVTPAGSTDVLSVPALRALQGRPHGQQWIERLYAQIEDATSAEVSPPVPQSPGRSTSTRN